MSEVANTNAQPSSEATPSTQSRYSRMLGWEMWNFQSIEHAKLNFDERGIINIKGYNNSGKSACLYALRVLFLNSDVNEQVKYIKDGKDYFRIVAYFDDGISILRDKYKNGQSLYEVYKGGNCIFTTKSANGVLTKVSKVPDEIEAYLGLIMFSGNSLNIRSCFEKQLGVQTTGSENYQMFNQVLKSEEISAAITMLNGDKNRKAQEVAALESQVSANKNLLQGLKETPEELLNGLEKADGRLDVATVKESELTSAKSADAEASTIVVHDKIDEIDVEKLNKIINLTETNESIANMNVLTFNVPTIDTERLSALSSLNAIFNDLSNLGSADVTLEEISSDRLNSLLGILTMQKSATDVEAELVSVAQQIHELGKELESTNAELRSQGVHLVKCPNCGEYFDSEGGHSHG